MANNRLLKIVANVKDWFTVAQGSYRANPNERYKTLEELSAYLDDPHVAACVKSRKAGVLKLKFNINDNEAAPEVVDLVKNALERIDTYGITSQMLNFPYLGFQPMEIYYTIIDGLYMINDIKAKPAYWFKFDELDNIKFIDSKKASKIAPKYKVTVLRNNPTYTNPYGEALLNKLHFNMQFKRMALNYYAQYIENYGMPYTHVTCTSLEDVDAAMEVAQNLKSNAVGVSTDGIKCNTIEATNASATNYENYLKFHNDEISKAILGQTLTTDVGTSGSYALGTVQNLVRQDIIEDDKRNIESAWNEIIYNLVNVNFEGVSQCPIVELKAEFAIDKTRAERDAIVFTNNAFGFKPTKDYLTREYGYLDTDIEINGSYSSFMPTDTESVDDDQPVMPSEDVQSAAMNGAQVQSMVSILQSAATKQIPLGSVMPLLKASFPSVSNDILSEIVAPLESFSITPTQFAEDDTQMYTTEGGKRYDLSGYSAIVQDIIGSVLNGMEKGESYDELQDYLVKSFDGIDDKEAQDYIGTAIALSSYAGRIDGVK